MKVTEIVKDLLLGFNDLDTSINLNIILLGSYDILIGMDWLKSHKYVIDYLHKIFSSVDEEDKYNHQWRKFIDLYLHDKFQHYNVKSVLRKGVNFMASKLKNLSPKKNGIGTISYFKGIWSCILW